MVRRPPFHEIVGIERRTMKAPNLKTTIKVGDRKIRLDDMGSPAVAELITLLNLHCARLSNMYNMGKVRANLYEALKKKKK